MNPQRRTFLNKAVWIASWTLAAAYGWLPSASAKSLWTADKFAAGNLDAALKALFGNKTLTESEQIELKIPLIAENGAIVPVTVSSSLTNVQKLYLLVEKNPVPLAGQFDFSPDLDIFVSARIKMAETCNVVAIAETDQGLFSKRQLVKVTIGGCGG